MSTISPKVTAATLAAAIVGLVAWGVQAFAGINLPVEVVSALTVIVTFLAGYLKVDPQRTA